jgi:glycosyltransferase involved in cell wall biosynthesis
MKISLVILTRNEIVGLKEVFHKIPLHLVDEYFAVDGGSIDGTLEFFQQMGVPVVLQQKLGRGEAFRLAFERASGDALIFFSPDGNEDPLDIPKFAPILQSGADLVIGTRMIPGAHNEEDELLFPFRKWANQTFTRIANLVWNRGDYITDTINGYRAIRRSAWNQLCPDGSGYTIEYQSSIRAFKLHLKIREFPTHEGSRIDGREGSPSMKTGWEFLKLFFYELRIGKSFFKS